MFNLFFGIFNAVTGIVRGALAGNAIEIVGAGLIIVVIVWGIVPLAQCLKTPK